MEFYNTEMVMTARVNEIANTGDGVRYTIDYHTGLGKTMVSRVMSLQIITQGEELSPDLVWRKFKNQMEKQLKLFNWVRL